jgi:hypothetical protein
VGDTAAVIATYSSNKLILVEASDYFSDFLEHNVQEFPNEVVIQKILIADGKDLVGSLYHQSGTAKFYEGRAGSEKIKTKRLCEIADSKVCFVKTDTDGFDFQILISSLDWLQHSCPGVLFENQIFSEADLENANYLYEQLWKIGYRFYIVWDDSGLHIVSTNDLDTLIRLNYYLFKASQQKSPMRIYNFDVLCLCENDQDVYTYINQWYDKY